MADYKVTDTELISVANKIRTKSGTQAQLEWPNGYLSSIDNIGSGSSVIQPLQRQRYATLAIDNSGYLDPRGYATAVIMEWQLEIGKRYVFYLPESVGNRFAVSMYDQEVFAYSQTPGVPRLAGDVVVARINTSPSPYYSISFVATKSYLCAYIDNSGSDLYSYVMELQYE